MTAQWVVEFLQDLASRECGRQLLPLKDFCPRWVNHANTLVEGVVLILQIITPQQCTLKSQDDPGKRICSNPSGLIREPAAERRTRPQFPNQQLKNQAVKL